MDQRPAAIGQTSVEIHAACDQVFPADAARRAKAQQSKAVAPAAYFNRARHDADDAPATSAPRCAQGFGEDLAGHPGMKARTSQARHLPDFRRARRRPVQQCRKHFTEQVWTISAQEPGATSDIARAPERDHMQGELVIEPVAGEPVSFGAATIERWYYQARAAGTDRIGALRKRVRKDAGSHRAVTSALGAVLRSQYEDHPTWSYQLHADNLVVVCEQDRMLGMLGPCPSYATLRRYMKSTGLLKRRRQPNLHRPGAERARARLEAKEVLS